jgi:hypothetical protein
LALNCWLKTSRKTAPTHPKLFTYAARRLMNLMKLSLIFCLSRGGEKIDGEDFAAALDLLTETETCMADAFKAMRTGGPGMVYKEAWEFLYTRYMKNREQPIPRHYLVTFLHDKVPSYSLDKTIDMMVQGKLISEKSISGVGICYIPTKRHTD